MFCFSSCDVLQGEKENLRSENEFQEQIVSLCIST